MTNAEVEAFLEKYCILEGEPPLIENGIVKRADYVAFKPTALALKKIPVIFEVIRGAFDCVNLGYTVEFLQYPTVGRSWYLGSDRQITKAFLLHLINSSTPIQVDVAHSDEWRMPRLRKSLTEGEQLYATTDYYRKSLRAVHRHLQLWYSDQMEVVSAPFEPRLQDPSLCPTRYNRIGWCSVHFNYGRKCYEPRKDIPFRRVGLFPYVYNCLKTYWQTRDYIALLETLKGTLYEKYLTTAPGSVNEPPVLDAL